MATNIIASERIVDAGHGSPWWHTLGAMAFGLMLVFAVAFTPLNFAHNAAHDTRHTIAVPCH